MLIDKVGETAGSIWQALDKKGPHTVAALKKLTKATDLTLHMALGWLAREDKIEMVEDGRSFKVSLK